MAKSFEDVQPPRDRPLGGLAPYATTEGSNADESKLVEGGQTFFQIRPTPAADPLGGFAGPWGDTADAPSVDPTPEAPHEAADDARSKHDVAETKLKGLDGFGKGVSGRPRPSDQPKRVAVMLGAARTGLESGVGHRCRQA